MNNRIGNDTIYQILNNVWLSKLESKIFFLCFQYGPISISTLARLSKTARSTLYGLVQRLMKGWFLLESNVEGGNQYSSISFEQLLSLLWSKKQSIENNIEELKSQKLYFDVIKSGMSNLPIVKFYKTNEIISVMYEKIMQSDFVRSVFDIDRGMKYFNMNFEEMSNAMRMGPWVTKRILLDSPAACEYKKKFKRDNYQIKLMSHKWWFQSDMMIMDDSVYHVSYDKELIGIEIYDKAFFAMQTIMFDKLWDSL